MTKHGFIIIAVVFLLGFLAYTDSQENVPSAEEILRKASNVIDIPELNNLNTSAIPALDEVENLFKKKCDKNGGGEAFENAKHALEDMSQCLTSLINVTQLQAEMEKYKPTGDLDIVFRNYCRKRPILQRCVNNFTIAIEPCLEEKEQESKRLIQNITDSLLSFVCFKEGDRIALFISAGGPECFESKQQGIQNCVNQTFGHYLPTPDANSLGLESIPTLVLENKECTDITSLQSCVVRELETCTDPTPANIVDSIFNFILRVTPCESILSAQSAASSDTHSSATRAASLLSLTSITFLVLKFM